LTLAAQFARDKNKEAAEFLGKMGANVDFIGYGAALGGDIDYAEILRLEQKANKNWSARGAAEGGYQHYADRLHLENNANENYLAMGSGRGGHLSHANFLAQEHEVDKSIIAKAMALGGHEATAEKFRDEYNNHVDSLNWAPDVSVVAKRNFVNKIAKGTAEGGFETYVELLRRDHGADIVKIAYGAARGCHQEYTDKLLSEFKEEVSINLMAQTAVEGGHLEYAEMLYRDHGAKPDSIIFGAVLSGHVRDECSALRFLIFSRNSQYRSDLATHL
jgi:hypothetical protein